MEINEQNLEAVATCLQKTLSPNGNERSEGKTKMISVTARLTEHSSLFLAEQMLKQIERKERYSSLLLTLCERATTNDGVRRAAVITFKNYIKRNWPSLEGSDLISLADRDYIKDNIVDLMTRSPEHIQEQLSDAITVIGKRDFPDRWPNLMEKMIKQFQQQSSSSFQSIIGVLKTAHSLFERYRYEPKSEHLWTEIKLVLDQFASPFTHLFQVSR